MLQVADLAENYGSGQIRLTVGQNIIIPNVPDNKIGNLTAEPVLQYLRYDPSEVMRGLVSCTGMDYCHFALIETKGWALKTARVLEAKLGKTQPLRMHWSGCPAGCGNHSVADIGLLGKNIKINGEVVEAVDVFAGGDAGCEPNPPIKIMEDVPCEDLPTVVAGLVKHGAFKAMRQQLRKTIEAGATKGKLGVKDLLIRGILSGALLGFATTLALMAAAQTGLGIVGALIFPVGFVMIVLFGLELVTGNFALVPLGVMDGKIKMGSLWFNWSWVFLGNLIGGVLYAILFAKTLTPAAPLTKLLVTASEAKTLGYAKLGYDGLMSAFVKAILCNWMVTMGVVMSLRSQSTIGKIAAMWLPILTFFAQGFEHSVVNMFVIPTGMMLGSQASFSY